MPMPTTTKYKPHKLEPQLSEAYTSWVADQSPEAAGRFLNVAAPFIDSALTTSGAPGSPAVRADAKVLLLNSLPKYDPSKGVPISNWLWTQLLPVRRIAANTESMLPVPDRMRRLANDVDDEFHRLSGELGREPSELELADSLKLSPAKLRKVRAIRSTVVPESKFVDETGAPDAPATYRPDPHQVLADYVYFDLPPIDQRIFEMIRDRVPKNEIARKLKLSPASVTKRAAGIAKKIDRLYSQTLGQKTSAAKEREYACLMAPIDTATAREVYEWGVKNIADEHLYSEGDAKGRMSVDDMHVTIMYGLHTDDPQEVAKAIDAADRAPVRFTLGRVIRFERDDRDYDVLVVDVKDGDLPALNEVVRGSGLRVTNMFTSYRPHVTIAYVKRGTCRTLVGNKLVDGRVIACATLDFSDKDKNHTPIELGGAREWQTSE